MPPTPRRAATRGRTRRRVRKNIAIGQAHIKTSFNNTIVSLTDGEGNVIAAPLPAVVAVSDAINEPRYPSLKGIMGAKKKPQETVSLGDLGVEADRAGEAGSRTEVYAIGHPPPRGETQRIDDDGSGAEKIVEFLLERKAL